MHVSPPPHSSSSFSSPPPRFLFLLTGTTEAAACRAIKDADIPAERVPLLECVLLVQLRQQHEEL